MRATSLCNAALISAAMLGLFGFAVPCKAGSPDWREWSPQVFEQARREKKLVMLDIVAEWCLTCKKMDLTTYRDPRVLETIQHRYIAVRADVDRVAEIKRRYGDYGVPAVVIFDGTGTEIVKRRGYLEPEWLYWLLEAVADDPRPEAHR